MEPTQDAVRHRLVLGKFPVIAVERTAFGFKFVLQLPGIKLVLEVPPSSDVREGDILTLYTEVLAHAKSSKPPIQ
jgi:hypothetical protein